MAGGKSTPKKDVGIKISNGQLVKTGQILARGLSAYKAGEKCQRPKHIICPLFGESAFF